MASTLRSRATGAWLSGESNVELAETNKGFCERNERKANVRFGSKRDLTVHRGPFAPTFERCACR